MKKNYNISLNKTGSNLSMIPDNNPFNIIIISPTSTGKSTLITCILSRFCNKFYNACVISGSEEDDPYFSKFIPKKFIKYEFKDKYIDKIKETYNLMKEMNEPKHKRESIIILDDVSNELKGKNKNMTNLFTRGRHMQSSVIVTTQYAKSIPSVWRENAQFIFIGELKNENSINAVYELVSCVFPTKDIFKYLLKKYARNYKFLCVNMRSKKSESDSDSSRSVDFEAMDIEIIKRQVHVVKPDPKLRTKLLPDEFRTKKEIIDHYNHIGRDVHRDSKNNLFVNLKGVWKKVGR